MSSRIGNFETLQWLWKLSPFLGRSRGLNHSGFQKSLRYAHDDSLISGYDSFLSQYVYIYIYKRLFECLGFCRSPNQLFWLKKIHRIKPSPWLQLPGQNPWREDIRVEIKPVKPKKKVVTTVKWKKNLGKSIEMCPVPIFRKFPKVLQVAFLGSNSFVPIPSLSPFWTCARRAPTT